MGAVPDPNHRLPQKKQPPISSREPSARHSPADRYRHAGRPGRGGRGDCRGFRVGHSGVSDGRRRGVALRRSPYAPRAGALAGQSELAGRLPRARPDDHRRGRHDHRRADQAPGVRRAASERRRAAAPPGHRGRRRGHQSQRTATLPLGHAARLRDRPSRGRRQGNELFGRWSSRQKRRRLRPLPFADRLAGHAGRDYPSHFDDQACA